MDLDSEDEIEAKKVRYSSSACDRNREKYPNEEIRGLVIGVSANSFMREENFLSTGCPHLDVTLKGGFPNRGITQIYGAAGTGKTQIALQLCLTVQLPISVGGYGAGAIYISTEGTFPSKRLQDLLRYSNLAAQFNITANNIFVERVIEPSQLEKCLLQRIPYLMACRKIGLLVLDSIAAPYRGEYSSTELKNRGKDLWNISRQLHKLARQYNLTVVCINQVSAVISPSKYEAIYVDERPALGIIWANMITNNFYLCRNDTHRYFHVMQSSYLGRSSIEYIITNSGVMGVA